MSLKIWDSHSPVEFRHLFDQNTVPHETSRFLEKKINNSVNYLSEVQCEAYCKVFAFLTYLLIIFFILLFVRNAVIYVVVGTFLQEITLQDIIPYCFKYFLYISIFFFNYMHFKMTNFKGWRIAGGSANFQSLSNCQMIDFWKMFSNCCEHLAKVNIFK